MTTSGQAFATRPDLVGSFGMAASTHWVATGVAQSVLECGGNAFDAAVAAGFVLHVVEPHLNGPGGDMVALIARPTHDPIAVCGQGPAPRAASIAHYQSQGLASVPGSGALAAAIPGAVPAWLHILRDFGTWDVADILEYAIHYAEVGQPIGPQASAAIATMAQHFVAHWPTSAAQWLDAGRAPQPGDVLTMPRYAHTLRRLLGSARHGSRVDRIDQVAREWSSGFVAQDIERAAARPHRHSSGHDLAGVLTAQDLRNFRVTTEDTISLNFRGFIIYKAGFWSQGPTLLQALAILSQFADSEIDPDRPGGAHNIIEALKLALADRDAYYGDNEDNEPARMQLLSDEYARGRAAAIRMTASGEWAPGNIAHLSAYEPPLQLSGESPETEVPGSGEPTVSRDGVMHGDTVHLDVADRWGNMVSATPSGGWLQSNPAIPELGFCLGTRLQMTWLDARSPSALIPNMRPRTTLSPTLVRHPSGTVTALGTPGGDEQDQWQLLYLLRTIVGKHSPQQAIDAPMYHTSARIQSFWPREWTPRGVVIESRAGDALISGLRDRGHEVSVAPNWTLGRLTTVSHDQKTGRISAAANPRGMQGYAAGR